MLLFFTGFFAGLLHVLSGPDHLAAVSPIAVENKKSSWFIGLKWGIGHTGGVYFVGILLLIFREFINVDLLASYSEKLVGFILIVIGIWGLQKLFKKNIHEHEHDGSRHYHLNKNWRKVVKNKQTNFHTHTHTAMVVGILHGFAGSSHLLGVLPALALPSKYEAAIYLLAFGIGSILAMVLFSQAVGILSFKFAEKSFLFYRRLGLSFSSVAIAVGVFWIYISI